MIPGMPEPVYISREDYDKMKELGMTVKEYKKAKEDKKSKLEDMSIEELLEESVKDIHPTKRMPSIIVVDNFYDDPDTVRDYAMSGDFVPRGEHGAVGHRTLEHKHFKGVKKEFESLLGSKMKEGTEVGGWDYQTNGVFQHCMAEDPFVIHADTQQWAAMIYLTPDAPPQCGTSLYRHKETKVNSVREMEGWTIFKENFYDETPFEKVDTIGNVYNRLMIFDARLIHAASQYFGDAIDNDRLFQIFFFDTEDANDDNIEITGVY